MTTNKKVAIAALVGGLALVVGLGAYEIGKKPNDAYYAPSAYVPTPTPAGVIPGQPVPVTNNNPPPTAVVPTSQPDVVTSSRQNPPNTLVPNSQQNVQTPYRVVGPAAVVPSNPPNTPYYVRTPAGAVATVTPLQAEQPTLAPGQTVVQRTVVEPVPANGIYTTRTTAYVPQTQTHRVYVHRRVYYRHRSSGKIHVARAVKHTVAFAVKMPGRLRM